MELLENIELKISAKEFTVTEISNLIKKSIEHQFNFVKIKGEISGYKLAPSGHGYFSLKDQNSVLSAVCWKGNALKYKSELKEGAEVVCTGSVTTYGGQSKYQLIVEKVEEAGLGQLMLLLEERRKKFIAEGLFDQSRKKKLPFLPQIVGVITSPTGAVIRDILHRISDRCPVRVIIWPVLVQGSKSAEQITAAIKGFNTMVENQPDVIIVARGGGSFEDLWSFNEENVVRAAAGSMIPLISAVGHETDVTLIDFASDVRAPTPTAAAELAVPVKKELEIILRNVRNRLNNLLDNNLKLRQARFESVLRALPNYAIILNDFTQKIDDLYFRITPSLKKHCQLLYIKLGSLCGKVQSPNFMIKIKQQKLSLLWNHLLSRASQLVIGNEHRFALFCSKLESYDYHQSLRRGFALVTGADGNLISSKMEAAKQQELIIEFQDGKMVVRT